MILTVLIKTTIILWVLVITTAILDLKLFNDYIEKSPTLTTIFGIVTLLSILGSVVAVVWCTIIW